jgi:hypothetical protein
MPRNRVPQRYGGGQALSILETGQSAPDGWLMSQWSRLSPRTKLWASLAALLIALAFADAVVSTHGLPEIPRNCLPPDLCLAQDKAFHDRYAQITDLRAREQLWWALAAAALAGAVLSGRPTEDEKLRRYFANVGTLGVLFGVVTFAAMELGRGAGLEGTGGWFLYPAIPLIGLAGLGAVYVRIRHGGRSQAEPELAPSTGGPSTAASITSYTPLIAALLVLAASLTSIVWVQTKPACGSLAQDNSHIWEAPAAVLTLGAMAFGLFSLTSRRWLIALGCLVIPAFAFVVAYVLPLCG